MLLVIGSVVFPPWSSILMGCGASDAVPPQGDDLIEQLVAKAATVERDGARPHNASRSEDDEAAFAAFFRAGAVAAAATTPPPNRCDSVVTGHDKEPPPPSAVVSTGFPLVRRLDGSRQGSPVPEARSHQGSPVGEDGSHQGSPVRKGGTAGDERWGEAGNPARDGDLLVVTPIVVVAATPHDSAALSCRQTTSSGSAGVGRLDAKGIAAGDKTFELSSHGPLHSSTSTAIYHSLSGSGGMFVAAALAAVTGE